MLKLLRAYLYLCESGAYECYINGKKAGKETFVLGDHFYDYFVQASVNDVT